MLVEVVCTQARINCAAHEGQGLRDELDSLVTREARVAKLGAVGELFAEI